jgi:hypothetical protein
MSQFSSVTTLPNSTFRDSAGHQSGQTPKLSGIIPESVSGHIPESVSGAIPDSVSGSGRNTQDPQGRLFRERPAGEIALLFERLGFRLVLCEESADSLGRETLRWTTLVLRLDATGGVQLG